MAHSESSFRLVVGNKTVYIDPFRVPQSEFSNHKADVILITHIHFDHYVPEQIRLISKSSTIFVAPEDVAHELRIREGVSEENIRVIRPGEHLQVEGIMIRAVRAYTTVGFPTDADPPTHPIGNNWVGYVVTTPDGSNIYHAGDTELTPEVRALLQEGEVRVGLFPVGGMGAMGPQEAAEAAMLGNVWMAFPMHFGALPGQTLGEEAAGEFVRLLSGTNVPARILIPLSLTTPESVELFRRSLGTVDPAVIVRQSSSDRGGMQKGGGEIIKEDVDVEPRKNARPSVVQRYLDSSASKIDKGVLVSTYKLSEILVSPVNWLLKHLGKAPVSQNAKEDFAVPVIEEGLLMLTFFLGPWVYVFARIVFIALHAFQDRAPPEERKRTLFEKIFIPSIISTFSIVPFLLMGLLPTWAIVLPVLGALMVIDVIASPDRLELSFVNFSSVTNSQNENVISLPIKDNSIIPDPKSEGFSRSDQGFGEGERIARAQEGFNLFKNPRLYVVRKFEEFFFSILGELVSHFLRPIFLLSSLAEIRPDLRESSNEAINAGSVESISSSNSSSASLLKRMATVSPFLLKILTIPFIGNGNLERSLEPRETIRSSNNPLSRAEFISSSLSSLASKAHDTLFTPGNEVKTSTFDLSCLRSNMLR